MCPVNEISFQEGGKAFHFEKFRPDPSCSEKSLLFFSFPSHSSNEHCRVRGTVIHWQANNSHSPKAIYVAQRPALLALLSEEGGVDIRWHSSDNWARDIIHQIKRLEAGRPDFMSTRWNWGKLSRWNQTKGLCDFWLGVKIKYSSTAPRFSFPMLSTSKILKVPGMEMEVTKTDTVQAKIMTGACLKGMEVAVLSLAQLSADRS